MSALAATQIPKPSDEQAFERASIPLWCGLLKDPNVQRNARRGQGQDGVDLYGMRDRDPNQYVGIQCKLKGNGKELTEKEVRAEVDKALKFKPALREYFIVTTAPDDGDMHELARTITAELRASGRPLLVYIWGWNILEEKISQDADARKAFDPDYGPFSARILEKTEEVLFVQTYTRSDIAQVQATLTKIDAKLNVPPGDTTVGVNALEAHLDADIDTFRQLATSGKPRMALPLLESLLGRVQGTASGRILFRIKANIGACLLALNEDERAAAILAEAYDHAPTEPKAIANNAFSLLLQGRWEELLSWGKDALKDDPTNEGLAGYLVQAARFDMSIDEPLDLLPDALKSSAAAAVGRVDFIRRRRSPAEWWAAAREAAAAHPDEQHAVQFSAEADLDEILSSERFHRTRLLTAKEREQIKAAAEVLIAQWDEARITDGVLRPEDVALCGNIIVAQHALDNMEAALEIVRQGLALAPDDPEIISRAAVVALDAPDEVLAEQLLARLPTGPDAVVLRFRFHSAKHNWAELARLHEEQAEHIPEVERGVINAAGRLAAIKLAATDDNQNGVRDVARDVEDDPRASIVVADFARMEGLQEIADAAFRAALGAISEGSHVAARMMVALHAARRGDWRIAADLMDTHVAEDHDSFELRALARALVNDSPIRQRALRFFERLPDAVGSTPFFLHAKGLLHFNRGDLRAAEVSLQRAVEAQPDLDNYLALFSVLRRGKRDDEIKPILDGIDLATVHGTPGEKMYLAQSLRAAGEGEKALAYAYDVLQSATNDPDAALRYFGLIMMSPDDGLIPSVDAVGIDTWVRLEGEHGKSHAFLIEGDVDRPADDILSPSHPTAAAATGLQVGDSFTMEAAFGDDRVWRVAEIKHKYLHALHDVMENFEKRFPNAKGFYTVTMKDGDVGPALEQVRRASEGHRKLADLYLVRHLPLNMVASHLGGDTIGFAEYVRWLGFDIQTCVGTEPERLAAAALIENHRAGGAVLDAYTAWTASTMDAFDALAAVFGSIVVPQSAIDELRMMLDKQEISDRPSMTVGWHDGQYIKQEHTSEDVAARRALINQQIAKIEAACEVRPSVAPDCPTELAAILTDMFDAHVLDAAHLAAEGYVLVSEDMYFRQIAEAAVSARGVWLQTVFAFARHMGEIGSARYADATVKLAWRRHSHVSIDPETLLEAFETDDTEDLAHFAALVAFIGTKNAEMRSHLNVVLTFLNHIWANRIEASVKSMKATSILLDRLIRHRHQDWALVLAFLKEDGDGGFPAYLEGWVKGHFLPAATFATAELEIAAMKNRVRMRRARVPLKAPASAPRKRKSRDRRQRRGGRDH